MKKKTIFIAFGCSLLLLTSCTTVKSFQKSRINDAEMGLASRSTDLTSHLITLALKFK